VIGELVTTFIFTVKQSSRLARLLGPAD